VAVAVVASRVSNDDPAGGHGRVEAGSDDRQRPERVAAVLVSGHLVDAPDRPTPRFPSGRVGWVAEQVRAALDDWQVGPSTTLVCGGARGADIIAAEEAYARGARVTVCLALPAEEFETVSVALPGTDWADRFRRLLAVADVHQLTGVAPGDNVFALANEMMLDVARRIDPRPYALVVWDGRAGDGPGGTADLVVQLGYPPGDPRLLVVDPTPPQRLADRRRA
jgi:hypothetical protein